MFASFYEVECVWGVLSTTEYLPLNQMSLLPSLRRGNQYCELIDVYHFVHVFIC